MNSLFRRRRLEQRRKEEKEKARQIELAKMPLLYPLNIPLVPTTSKYERKPVIALTFKPNLKKGGSHHFVSSLVRQLQNQCIFTYNLASDYDLLFINADLFKVPIDFLLQKKAKGVKIIQRMDGCFYQHGYPAGGEREINQRLISQQANLVIHQSQFGKNSMEDAGITDRNVPNVVIYNGVDRSIFTAANHTLSSPLSIISANNSTLKIKRVERLNQFIRNDVKITHIGRYHRSVRLDKAIQIKAPVEPKELNTCFSASNVFIHTGDYDTCPNVVIEALANGLPIIYWNSGGVPELVADAGVKVDNYISPNAVIEEIKAKYNIYQQNAIRRSEKYDIVSVAQQYYDMFIRVLQGEI